MKVIGIIQARMNSKRLPGKVMISLDGKPVVWHIYNRLCSCKSLDQIIISTGDKEHNTAIINFAKQNKIPIYVGSENDLIDRLYNTGKSFGADAMVRITSDCPFVDPQLVDMLVEKFKKSKKYDIVTNCQIHTYPHGLEIEVYSQKILKLLWKTIKEKEFREWFPIYIQKNSKQFKILNIKNKTNQSNIRLTLDYKEDLELVKKIYKKLYGNKNIFLLKDIMHLLKKSPQLLSVNSKYIKHRNLDAPIM